MSLTSFLNLCKPKIVLLLTITASVGMLISIEFYENVTSGLASLLGFSLLAAASAALNQIFDRETDKNMNRTKTRPLASGEISLFSALTFTAILLFAGSSLLLYFSNLLTLLITTFGFIFYSLIYTIYLKWTTPQNIVIGGLSGALPPLIGWTAVNNDISLLPLTLVLVIFLWTPPHFWPLAIDRMDEYKKEGVPMMPIAKGVSRTKKEMIVYSILLLAASLAPFIYGLTGYFYLVSTTLLNLYFIYLCIAYLNDRENQLSMKIFNFSVKYMFLFFLTTYIDFLILLYA
tara:strand:+ start:6348 stop:7214 length:867 start_codon:yes stop_codon:yes gene_type:complete